MKTFELAIDGVEVRFRIEAEDAEAAERRKIELVGELRQLGITLRWFGQELFPAAPSPTPDPGA